LKKLFLLLFLILFSFQVQASGLLNSFWFAAGGAFDYDDIANRELHLIAESLTGSYNDGDALTASPGWPDDTTNYNYNTIGGTPTLETGELNSLAIVDFIGSSSERVRDTSPNIPSSNKWTIAYVLKTPTSAAQVYLLRSNSSDTFILKRNTNDYDFLATNDVVTLDTGNFTPSVGASNWQVIIWVVDFTAGAARIYINSTTAEQTPSSSTDSTDQVQTYYNIPTNTGYPDIQVAEFLVYNGTAATNEECGSLMTHLTNKYGISI